MPSRFAARLLGPAVLIGSLGPLAPAAHSVEAAGAMATSPTPTLRRPAVDPITGPRSRLPRDWIGTRPIAPDTPILVLAGHADSQGIGGSGTSGATVAAGGAPMLPGISDELYWNMAVAELVVALGQQRGLPISYYRPPLRSIADGNHPSTNWSVGRLHAAAGGYALEIHFDAWGPTGIGSGLIPPLHRPFSRLDESLAEEFGGYPMGFRDGLGGPRRGIALLEVGKLEGTLERALRNPSTRAATLQHIATRIVGALELGLGRNGAQPATTATTETTTESTAEAPPLSPPPGGVGSAPPARGLQASSEGE
ncbi:dehydrogenase [Synechococcus sp. CCY 9618]|uniref:dehydrogenase n=1 Tax=Synechococcus sp. CCY 9618 TaxID=2815602 RepID=UPI001C2124F9|nr:dehydrogenase [Synechococcus sp. CCY 9618]